MGRTVPLGTATARMAAKRPARFTAALAVCSLVLGAQGLVGALGGGGAGASGMADPSSLSFSSMVPDEGPRLATGAAGVPPVGRVESDQPDDGEVQEHALAPAPIATLDPRILLEADRPLVGDPVQAALEVEGVTFATLVRIGEVALDAGEDTATVTVAAVDVDGFRPLTPQITADATDLWQRLLEGDAAFTHDVGTRLELVLGSRVNLAEEEEEGVERRSVRVGAFASNGVPPIADAVVSGATARELGLTGTPTLLVATAEGVPTADVAERLAAATGMRAEVIEQPDARRAFLTGAAARNAFEPFSYVSIGDGMINIDPAWVARNIVTERVPIFRGAVTCHRLVMPQLRGALEDVVEQGLEDLIDPSQYGGCWVPRHILFNPRRAISMHAWGLAIDFNVRGNEYGNRNPQMDPRIVEIFERWGFSWGGHWSTPDGMHFELGALLDSDAA